MLKWLIKKQAPCPSPSIQAVSAELSSPASNSEHAASDKPSTSASDTEQSLVASKTVNPPNACPPQNPHAPSSSSASVSEPATFCPPQNRQSSSSSSVSVPPDLDLYSPSQPKLSSYPKRPFGQALRCFNAGNQSRPWLEYSLLRDASFCFPCRKFSVSNSERDDAFTKVGYTNWKKALIKNSGFQKHASGTAHVRAMSAWQEYQCRTETDNTIVHQLGQTHIEKNRYYVKSIGEVIQFLAVNELALRGHHHGGGDEEGLLIRLFDYTLQKDPKLAEIAKSIPENAKYTSNLIQNEMIQTLAKMVLKDIQTKYEEADSPGLCIKSDGTRDRCNIENLSVIIRFVRNSIPEEHLIGLIELNQLDAEYVCDQILSNLSDLGYNGDNLVSQCYDGASVMSGVRGGVQALLQNKVGKDIPYVHCYNHQLHLAVVHAMHAEPVAKKFFDWSSSLNTFCHRHYVANRYSTPTLKRLLEIRWTSHYDVTKSIVHNEDVIRRLLSEIAEDDSAPFDINTEACGLLTQLNRQNFFDTGKFLLHVLGALKPANSILQSQTVDLCTAGEVVTASLGTLKEMRCDSFWEEHFSQCGSRPTNPPKRRRIVNSQLVSSVILSTIGHGGDPDDQTAPNQTFKRAMFNILDRAIVEMETRFSQRNVDLMRATSFLLPKSASFLDPSLLEPLQVLAGTEQNSMSLQNEIAVAKAMLLNKLSTDANLSEVCKCIQQYKDAFPILHKLYVTALIIGVSSAACESSFSTLSRILTPLRRSMLHSRKRDLVILAHEKKITKGLDMNQFVSEFAKTSRRLVL